MRLLTVLVVLVACTVSASGQVILFADDFEGSIRTEWLNYANGFTVTTANSQHGGYSVTTSIQDRYLRYDLGVPVQDLTFEGWFYDSSTADPYEVTLEISRDTGSGLAVGIDTFFDQSHYVYRLGAFNWISTSIPRSTGWHLGQIYRGIGSLSLLIDRKIVYQQRGGNDFVRFASLATNGAAGRNPSASYYLDNVRLYQGSPVPEPTTPWVLAFSFLAAVALRLVWYLRR